MYGIEGNTFETYNQVIGTSWAEIDPPGKFYGMLIKARETAATLYIKRKDTDTDYFTIPAGESLSLKVTSDEDNHFYMKSDTNPTTVEVLFVS